MMLADAHCHFFSPGFFRALGKDLLELESDGARVLPQRLGWDEPVSDEALADRWAAELERNGVGRAVLIASSPGDADAVATAVRQYPDRFVGAFMWHPGAPDAEARLDRAFGELGLRMVCLFPAMHGVAINDPRSVLAFAAAERHARSVFVHCGVLSIGVRKKLGLPSAFDLRLGDPLAAAAAAARHPTVPVVIPHFGAGFFSRALIAADAAPNVLFDSSSSNSWVKFHGLTLRDVFARTLDCVGPARILFGTDSSFFPRGWQRPIYEQQLALLQDLGVSEDARKLVFGGNFARVFGATDQERRT